MSVTRRPLLICGNMKMNGTKQEMETYSDELTRELSSQNLNGGQVVVFPSAISIPALVDKFADASITVGAQNVGFDEKGAYTGDISAAQLASFGVTHVLVGHNERRIFGEDDEMVNKKLKQALNAGLKPIICVGEDLSDREKKAGPDLVRAQLRRGLYGLNQEEVKNIIIAYEPVWAIGTGKVCPPEIANKMCGVVRQCIGEMYNKDIANEMPVLYAGSLHESNIDEIISQSDIDGGLCGGVSLRPRQFAGVIDKATQAHEQKWSAMEKSAEKYVTASNLRDIRDMT